MPPLASWPLAPLALGFAIGFRSVLTQARVAGSILSLLAITFIWRVFYVWRVRKTAAALLKVEADLYEAKENQDRLSSGRCLRASHCGIRRAS